MQICYVSMMMEQLQRMNSELCVGRLKQNANLLCLDMVQLQNIDNELCQLSKMTNANLLHLYECMITGQL